MVHTGRAVLELLSLQMTGLTPKANNYSAGVPAGKSQRFRKGWDHSV